MAGISRMLAISGLVATMGIGGAACAQSKDAAFNERVAAMKSMGDYGKVIAAFAARGEGSAAAAADAANKMAMVATRIPALFPPGSSEDEGLPKSRAKKDIWNDWPKFEAAAMTLKARSEAFAKAAESGDKAMIASASKGITEACGTCHKPFRGAKK
jgi:cytochrome c556